VEKRSRAQKAGMQLGPSLPQRAARSDWVGRLGRFGLLAQGVSYGIVGVLAFELAIGRGGKATSRQGALKTLADESGGAILIVLLAVGFAAYAVWRLAQAIFDRKGEGDDPAGLAKRVGQLGKAALYGALAAGAVAVVLGSGGSGTSGGGRKEAEGVLGWPGGRWIVGAAAIAILGVAAYQFYRAATKKFMRDIDTGDMSGGEERWTERLGIVGLAARGVVFGIAGWFLLKAAFQYDASEAVGIGGALAKLANAPYGPWLLGATAAGLVVFAAFCVVQSRYRQV
jgi:hypothetical protein